MKKYVICFFLAVALIFSLCSCKGANSTANDAKQTSTSAKDLLNEDELQLFNALVQMTKKDFFNPSAVRVLEVGRSYLSGSYRYQNHEEEPKLVIVRLQAENKVGGTLNNYYLVCVKAGEVPGKENEYKENAATAARYEKFGDDDTYSHLRILALSDMMKIKADFAEYADIGDKPTGFTELSDFDIGKINKALAEYWKDLGF